jgi:hypothetical protein
MPAHSKAHPRMLNNQSKNKKHTYLYVYLFAFYLYLYMYVYTYVCVWFCVWFLFVLCLGALVVCSLLVGLSHFLLVGVGACPREQRADAKGYGSWDCRGRALVAI